MVVLGIESSAHTLGIGIVDNGKILANERNMYKITDKGIIPSKVSDFHANNVRKTLEAALKSAKLSISEIDAIGYKRTRYRLLPSNRLYCSKVNFAKIQNTYFPGKSRSCAHRNYKEYFQDERSNSIVC